MRNLSELRSNILFSRSQKGSLTSIKYLNGKNIDFDVFLPTKNMNLQRGHVWSIRQKRELIMSILLRRFIPRVSILSIYVSDKEDDIYQVIDGKQRLSAMKSFFNKEFSLIFDDHEYYFKDLPKDYKMAISNYNIEAFMIYDEINKPIPDVDKIEWFKLINFNQTPQDEEHVNRLLN